MVTPDTLFTGKNCIYLEEVNSTNIFATELIAKTSPSEGTCIITDYQTAGRGQFGRFWHSERGKNLLVSIIFYPRHIKAKDQFMINIFCSLAVFDVVTHYTKEVKIKWPNDIYVNNQKIAGILVQNTLRNDTIKATVIGIGLNVNEKKFPDDIPNPISLSNITQSEEDLQSVFSRLCTRMEFYYLKLKAFKYHELKSAYLTHLFRMEETAKFTDSNGLEFDGNIQGVDDEGKILIRKSDGMICAYNFREVSYII